MKKKAVSMADIAERLEISTNAVSLALRGKEGVSSELRKRVIATANEMRYQGITKTQGYILALIPQRLHNLNFLSFYYGLCFDMESYASSLGYQLIIKSVTSEEEKELIQPSLLSGIACEGIMTIGNLSRDYCEMIRALGMRYIMVDQYYEGICVDSVTTANSTGSYLMTKHLIERGHQKIQFVGSIHRTSSLEDRWIGYKRAMREYGLPILDNMLNHSGDSLAMKENSDWIDRVLDEMDDIPTAYVCGNDGNARELIHVLEKRGIRCPEDFSIVGFDDIPSPNSRDLKLTTYATPKTEIAHTAIDLLLGSDRALSRRIELFGEAIYRNSVRTI